MQAAQATAMPGALEFLKYAESRNVEIFYVTNRKMVGYEGTEKNLKALGFPNVDPKHLLLRTGSSDKQERRNMSKKIMKSHFSWAIITMIFTVPSGINRWLSDLPKPTGSRTPGEQNSSSCPIQLTVTGRVQSMKETGGLLLLRRTK